jgi:hypothetical protein
MRGGFAFFHLASFFLPSLIGAPSCIRATSCPQQNSIDPGVLVTAADTCRHAARTLTASPRLCPIGTVCFHQRYDFGCYFRVNVFHDFFPVFGFGFWFFCSQLFGRPWPGMVILLLLVSNT